MAKKGTNAMFLKFILSRLFSLRSDWLECV